MRRWKMGIAVAGLSGMAVTCILFFLFLPVEAKEYRWIYLIFLLAAEGLIAGTPFITDRITEKGKHIFIVTGWSVIFGLEALLMFVTALLFLLFFPYAVPLFLCIEVILIGAATMLAGVIYAFGTRIAGTSEAENHAYAAISGWEQRLKCLMVRIDQKELSERLKRAAENLRFTDKSMLTAEDQQIETCITQLEKCTVEGSADSEREEMLALLAQLEKLIATRKYKS